MQDLIAGRVHFYVSPTLAIVPQYQSKQLKIIGGRRARSGSRALPDVPTLNEKGIDFVRFGWLGICAGDGTPQPIVDLLNRHVVSIVASPDTAT